MTGKQLLQGLIDNIREDLTTLENALRFTNADNIDTDPRDNEDRPYSNADTNGNFTHTTEDDR